jgi:two-component SAPR family response regulator
MSAPTLAQARVLIVEDDYVVASALRYLIESYDGVVIGIVPSVDRADTLLRTAPADIAVLDINLQGSSVAPLAEHLRSQGTPFVFVTGYAAPALLPDTLRSYPLFPKPVEGERLIATMIGLLGRSSPS